MTAESKSEQIARLHGQLDALRAQCHDATGLLNTERLRSSDLRAALRAITGLDVAAHGPAGAFAAAVRIAGDALEEGQPRG